MSGIRTRPSSSKYKSILTTRPQRFTRTQFILHHSRNGCISRLFTLPPIYACPERQPAITEYFQDNQLTVMCTTRGERRIISFLCQKECMERKFVISCRIMHNLIKLHHVARLRVVSYFTDRLQRMDKQTDGLTQRIKCIPVGRAILFRLSTHALQALVRVNNELTTMKLY